tara:strand:+ start:476 stop:853 length:378 start_codon:yes stop_codon:yes gene_type:complete
MNTIIVSSVIGLIVGIGGTIGIQQATKPKEEPKPIVIADPVAKELGKLDLVEPICHPDFIEKNGDGLCKLLWCMTQTNSATGEISGQMCDNISNVENKKAILEYCEQYKDEERERCVDVFFRRGS